MNKQYQPNNGTIDVLPGYPTPENVDANVERGGQKVMASMLKQKHHVSISETRIPFNKKR